MPREVRCPMCRCRLSIDSDDHDRVQCPECGETFDALETVGEEKEKRPRKKPARSRDDDYDDEPRPRRRRSESSSKGPGALIAILGGLFVVVLICSGIGYGVWKVAGGGREFTTFKVPGGNCSILMPGTPKEQTQNIGGMQLRLFAVEGWRGGYGVAYADLPPGGGFNLDASVQGFAGAYQGTVLSQRGENRNGDGYVEFEVETKKPKGYGSGRVLIIRGRLYEFFALGSDARLSKPEVRKFIDSFKLDSGPFPWEGGAAPVKPLQPNNPPPNVPGPNNPLPNNPPPNNPPPFPPKNPGPNNPATTKEELLGFRIGEVLRDAAPEGALLVGFNVEYSKFIKNDIIGTLEPIYRAAGENTVGQKYGKDAKSESMKIVAKPGYAVGAITAKAGLGIDGFSVTFMKISGDALDPNDSYESEWIGGMGGGPPAKQTGEGKPVVGILVRQRGNIAALGLVFKEK